MTIFARSILFSGIERPRKEGDKNYIELETGGELSYRFDKEEYIDTIRIQFDPDFERLSVSPNRKMRVFAYRLSRGLDFEPVKVPKFIVKSFRVLADGKEFFGEKNNYNSLVMIPVHSNIKALEIFFEETWGSDTVRIFACDFI